MLCRVRTVSDSCVTLVALSPSYLVISCAISASHRMLPCFKSICRFASLSFRDGLFLTIFLMIHVHHNYSWSPSHSFFQCVSCLYIRLHASLCFPHYTGRRFSCAHVQRCEAYDCALQSGDRECRSSCPYAKRKCCTCCQRSQENELTSSLTDFSSFAVLCCAVQGREKGMVYYVTQTLRTAGDRVGPRAGG